MNLVHPVIKGILIGSAIMLPITYVVGVTDPSRGVVAVATTVGMTVSLLIFGRLYMDWKGWR